MEHEAYRPGAQVLGDWNIVSCLGAGSYGKVFEIERSEFGQTYRAALKVITVPQSSAEVRSVISEGMSVSQAEAYFHGIVEELMHEFSIMFKLKGTANVVSCEDLRVLEHPDGIGWDILIRMELLHPLLPYVYEHSMARRDIIRLGIDICKALELCQRYNIIHRDIKPENIFISDNGDYKLGDFGIARTIERTTSGLSKKGTYSYMAPEVYIGKKYGFSVDTYSLGLVLYRMLNKNRGPFLPQPPEAITFSSREQALARRMSGEPLPRPFYGEGRLGEIVLKACAFDPKDRYSSPQQLRQELEAILYTQTDAAVIYPDGDELTMDRESYASARYAAAFGTSTSKSASATQGVFSDSFRTKVETTAEDRTQSAFDAEKPKRTSTKKKRKKKGRVIIGICAICLLIPAVLYVTGILPDPYYSFIHNIFEPQPIPEALQEFEDAGTLEKIYENGRLTGYRVETYGHGEHIATDIFDTAGNNIRNEIYNSDGTIYGYDQYEYDSKGNRILEEYYDPDGTLRSFAKIEYDSSGNGIKVEVYDSAGTLQEYYRKEYDPNGNCTKWELYNSNGTLQEYRLTEYDSNGNLTKSKLCNSDGTLQEYEQNEYDSNGNCTKRELYNSDGTLQEYVLKEYDVTGYLKRVEQYDGDTGMIYFAYELDSDGNEVKREIYTDGRLTQTWITEYDDAGNMVQSEVYIGGTLWYVNEYDQAGNLIRMEGYDDNEDLSGYTLYEYDSDGNQIKMEMYDSEDTLSGYILYEYDSNGNCLKSENHDPDGTLNRYTLYEWDINGTKTRQETYSADDELLNYWELNDVGEWVDYNADGTPVE